MRVSVAPLRWLMMLLISSVLFSCEEDKVDPELYGSIEGEVIDVRNNQPVANVSLTTTPGTSSFTTDAAGKFTISNIKIGTYSLVARKADYRSETISVNVTEGEPTQVRIVLDVASSSNVAPNVPFSPTPANQAVDQNVELLLKWRVSDPNGKSDSLRSTVILYESNSTNSRSIPVARRDTFAMATGLKYNTNYFWQVTVTDKAGLVTRGNIWTFRTKEQPDNQFLYVQSAGSNTDIYSSDANNGNIIRLTNTPYIELTPRLNSQQDLVAYTSNASGPFRLYTMNRDGSNQRAITPASLPLSNDGVGYCWSPDGAKLLFASYDKLWRINRDGTDLTLIATAPLGRNFRECDWNMQTRRIVVQAVTSTLYDSQIYLMDEDGRNVQMLLSSATSPGGNGRLDSPTFNMAGNRIMYTRDEGLVRDATYRQTDARIYTQNIDGSGLMALSVAGSSGTGATGKPSSTNDILPRFTGNGKIVFVNVDIGNLTPPSVWQMDADGRNRVRIVANATQPDSK